MKEVTHSHFLHISNQQFDLSVCNYWLQFSWLGKCQKHKKQTNNKYNCLKKKKNQKKKTTEMQSILNSLFHRVVVQRVRVRENDCVVKVWVTVKLSSVSFIIKISSCLSRVNVWKLGFFTLVIKQHCRVFPEVTSSRPWQAHLWCHNTDSSVLTWLWSVSH